MEAIKILVNKLVTHNLEIGSSHWVDVTYVNSPDSFYVRPLEYNSYMPRIQARGENMDVSDITIGTIVIFKSEVTRSYVRGRILAVKGDIKPLYNLHAMDIGCYENNIPLENIWRPYYECDLPSLVFHCQLADCAPRLDTWSESSIEAMRRYVTGERAKIIIRSKTADLLMVELYNSCPDDIGTLLVITGYACVGLCRNYLPRVKRNKSLANQDYYSPRHLQVDAEIHVRMQSGSTENEFYVIPVEEYKTYLECLKDFQSEVQGQKDMCIDDIKVNKPIAVYHSDTGKFERALVKEVFPEQLMARVQLVDWGTEVVEPLANLKPIPQAYKYRPAGAIYCFLHDCQLNFRNMKHYNTSGPEFLMTIETVSKDVSTPNIVTISPLRGFLNALKRFF